MITRYLSKVISITLLVLCMTAPAQSYIGISAKSASTVISSFIKHQKSLSDEDIVRFSNIAQKSGGTKIIGKELGKLKLPNDALEDVYMRIAVHQSKLSREEADGMFSRLHGTLGFRSTLSKIIGASSIKSSGHLYELRIADMAVQHGAKVRGIGDRFDDRIKKGITDIDVLLEIKGKTVAIEAKDYLSTTSIPLDKFRADMISLSQYAKSQLPSKVITVFSMSNKPNDALSLRILEKEAEKHNVELLFGNPQQLIIQLKQLNEIL